MINGCVPVYWGADNVLDYIPEGCFVDRRRFKSTDEVHDFLLSISPQEYEIYHANIVKFLKGDVVKKFNSGYFASTVVELISNEIKSRA